MSQSDINLLNPEELYSSDAESWKTLYKGDNPVDGLSSIINSFVLLPYPLIQSKLAAIYMLCSSKWSRILPILLCFGEKGTGKSTIAILAAKLHATSLCSANDTFSSIRNNLNKRFVDEDQTVERDGIILAWDNIYARSLQADPRIYQLFLYGYNRNSDKVEIANRDGTNISFRTFCPKIASSIEAIHLNPEFSELRRRMLVLNHKKEGKLDSKESEGLTILSANDLHDIEDFSWNDFPLIYEESWSTEDFIRAYVYNRRRVSKLQNRPVDKERWVISVDLITTGLTFEFFRTPREGAEFISEVFKLQDKYLIGDTSATYEHLKSFTEEKIQSQKSLVELMQRHGEESQFVIPSKELKDYVSAIALEGGLDTNSDPKTINGIMAQLGWRLSVNGWIKKG